MYDEIEQWPEQRYVFVRLWHARVRLRLAEERDQHHDEERRRRRPGNVVSSLQSLKYK